MATIKVKNGNKWENIALASYPIGSIYISFAKTSPSELFGGTWLQLKDNRVLRMGDIIETGGSDTVTITSANLPRHTHSVGAHTHGLNNHTHTGGAHTHTLSSHTHSVGAHAHGLNSHTHSIGAHSHGLNNHTHSYTAPANHTHGLSKDYAGAYFDNQIMNGGSTLTLHHSLGPKIDPSEHRFNHYFGVNNAGDASERSEYGAGLYGVTNSGGGSTSATTGGPSKGSTADSSAFNSGGPSKTSTANSSAFNSGGPSNNNTSKAGAVATGGPSVANTASSTVFNTSDGGFDNTAISVLPAYQNVYAWKRTA